MTAIFFGPFPRRRFASRLVTSFYFTFVSLHFRHEFDWSKMIHTMDVCACLCAESIIIFFIHILFACTHFFQHILSIEMEMFCLLTLSFIVNAQRSPKEEEERTHYVLMHFYTPQHIKLIMHDTNTNKHKHYTHNCFVLEYKIYAPLI